LAPQGETVDMPLGAKYEAHLVEHAEDIRDLLDGLQ
jgi:hypothetical protein